MGCSSQKAEKPLVPCTAEQKEEMFQLAVKDMMRLCAREAVSKGPEAVTIQAPSDDIGGINKLLSEVEGITKKLNPEKKQGKGVLDVGKGMLSAASKKAGLGGPNDSLDALTQALGTQADVLSSCMSALDPSFATLSQEIFAEKEGSDDHGECRVGWKKILSLYCNAIENSVVSNSFDLVRGSAPYGPAEFAACKSDKVISFFLETARAGLIESIEGIGHGIDLTKAVKQWVHIDEAYSSLNAKVSKINPKMKKPPIKLRPKALKRFIAEQVVEQLGVAMAAEEALQRDIDNRQKSGRSLPSNAANFDCCFSGEPTLDGLMVGKHYRLVELPRTE